MRALLDELEPEFGSFKVFRMNRDVRFSADKSPYKTAHAAMTESDGGTANYVQISATGLLVGAGIYHMARDQLERFRVAVGDDSTGERVEAAIAVARRARLDIAGIEPALATAPRGWPKDHPRVALLRMKGLITVRDFGTPAWVHTKRAANEVAKAWRAGAPVTAWLGGQRRAERGAATISVTATNPQYPRLRTRCGRKTMRSLISAIAGAVLVVGAGATSSAVGPAGLLRAARRGSVQSVRATDPSAPPATSEPAPPAWQRLEITDVDGVTFTLADCIGTPVLVELFATWCSNCRQQLPKTQEAAVTLGDQAAVIALSVETDIDPDAVAQYAEDNGFPDIRFAVISPELLAAIVEEFGNSAANPPSTPKIIIDAAGVAGEMTTGQESTEELVAQLTAAAAAGDTATTAP